MQVLTCVFCIVINNLDILFCKGESVYLYIYTFYTLWGYEPPYVRGQPIGFGSLLSPRESLLTISPVLYHLRLIPISVRDHSTVFFVNFS